MQKHVKQRNYGTTLKQKRYIPSHSQTPQKHKKNETETRSILSWFDRNSL